MSYTKKGYFRKKGYFETNELLNELPNLLCSSNRLEFIESNIIRSRKLMKGGIKKR